MSDRRPKSSAIDPTGTLVVAVVGIDGCGKSSTVRGALAQLAPEMPVASIADYVTTGRPGEEVRQRDDIPLSRSARAIGAVARGLRRPDLYKNLKLLEFTERTHIRNHLLSHESPAVILGDGDPLVNVSAWAAAKYLREEMAGDDARLLDLMEFMAGIRRIPARELPYYLRHVWQLALANRLHVAPFPVPDHVILLEITPEVSLARIRARGRPLQVHETEAFLADLAEGYERVCKLLATHFGIELVRLRVDQLGLDETVEAAAEAIRRAVAQRHDRSSPGPINPDDIHVIATTMSGSFADQKKVARIEPTFRELTDLPIQMHVADTHGAAERMAHDIVASGGRTIVSAGGAGTMNAVLEGAHVDGAVPGDLHLVFMRKGSADLVGKALHMPDDLDEAVVAIADSIRAERYVAADVLSVETGEPDGRVQVRHMLGFGGIGVFGDVPRFTESRFIKYYKGLLGTLLGDLGPFFVGLGLAALTWGGRCILRRVPRFELELDGARLPAARWQSVIFLNGDLGKDFPLGRHLPFQSGTLRVIVLHHRGIRAMLRQVTGSRTGSLLDAPAAHHATVREVRTLVARPVGRSRSFMVNVDGLALRTAGVVRVGVSGRVLLLDGSRSAERLVTDPAAIEAG